MDKLIRRGSGEGRALWAQEQHIQRPEVERGTVCLKN